MAMHSLFCPCGWPVILPRSGLPLLMLASLPPVMHSVCDSGWHASQVQPTCPAEGCNEPMELGRYYTRDVAAAEIETMEVWIHQW